VHVCVFMSVFEFVQDDGGQLCVCVCACVCLFVTAGMNVESQSSWLPSSGKSGTRCGGNKKG
jgi:hypothetical protein